MADTLGILGQSYPAAATPADLYTVPAATSTVSSTLFVCNTSVTATSFRVAVRKAGLALTNKQYIYYDAVISGNDTIALTAGLTLAATDIVTVYNAGGTVAFSLFGQETSA